MLYSRNRVDEIAFLTELRAENERLRSELERVSGELRFREEDLHEASQREAEAVAECRKRKGWDQDIIHWKERAEAAEAELAALRSPDYIIIPRTMLAELGDKIDALQAAIDQPVTTEGE